MKFKYRKRISIVTKKAGKLSNKKCRNIIPRKLSFGAFCSLPLSLSFLHERKLEVCFKLKDGSFTAFRRYQQRFRSSQRFQHGGVFIREDTIQIGNEIKTAFEREEITDDAAIKDLAYQEADTPIFTRLGLTYGKAMKFRKEFGEHVQSLQSRPSSPPVKPTMAAIASFSPEMRRLYLSKRKRVGVMATEKWGPKFPKFNSPQMKAELNEFSAKITPVCGIPEVGLMKRSTSSEDDDVEELPRKKKTEQKPVKIKASATPPNGVKKIRPTTTLDKTLEQVRMLLQLHQKVGNLYQHSQLTVKHTRLIVAANLSQ
ncbi:hypothetical protein OS493_001276 [Desmophyllum pertusum]|uniref:Uncharacterized protein n=1 Tax=Desmophyllum pertusum TaxID=174260 RepID=A0A9W9ZXN8_9CNID|nr:hypothetical protein OS493_001276 [Desmophyllum pertusum]